MTGVPASPTGLTGAEAPEPSSLGPTDGIPNAALLDYSVAMVLNRNDGTGSVVLSHMVVAAATEADAIGAAMAYVAKTRSGEHATKWSAICHATATAKGGPQ